MKIVFSVEDLQRLKKLRESCNYSQQDIATMLKTTQQTIARWEGGKAEPGLAALRDLALIFGTSIDDLLGTGTDRRRMASTTHHIFARDEQDGFWGHIGLRLGEKPSMWFPVTAGTASEVRSALANVEAADSWIAFETLANRFVAFRPRALRKVWLLDDNCDEVDGDWELDLPYQGLPLEMYRAFDRLYNHPVGEKAWMEAAAAIPREGPRGEPAGGDPEKWRVFVNQLTDAFDGEASEAFLFSVAETYADERLYQEDRYFRYMHHTRVCFVDGAIDEFWVEPDDLSNFAFELDLEAVPKILRLAHLDLSAEPYYSTDRIAAIIMPLIDLMDTQKEDVDED